MDHPGQPRYAMLSDHNGDIGPTGTLRPPPQRHNVPHNHHTAHGSPRKGCCRCGCLAWCCCCFLLFIILILGAVAYTYVYLNPKAPSYSIKDLSVNSFDFGSGNTLHVEITLVVRAENPNSKIGIVYGSNSFVGLSYEGTNVCSGRLPSFYQGYRNTTLVTIKMEGQHEFGPKLQESLQKNQKDRKIPLHVDLKVPVRLRVGGVDMKDDVKVKVHCDLVVDNIAPNKKVGIQSADYKVEVDW